MAFCSWHDPLKDAPKGRGKIGSEGQVMVSLLYCNESPNYDLALLQVA